MISNYYLSIRQLKTDSYHEYSIKPFMMSNHGCDYHFQILRDIDFSLVAPEDNELEFEIAIFKKRGKSYLDSMYRRKPFKILYTFKIISSNTSNYIDDNVKIEFSSRPLKMKENNEIVDGFYLSNPCLLIKKDFLEKSLK